MTQIENEFGNYGYGDHPRDKVQAHQDFTNRNNHGYLDVFIIIQGDRKKQSSLLSLTSARAAALPTLLISLSSSALKVSSSLVSSLTDPV